MPDDPISTTTNLGLGQWADDAEPGFEALNTNWDLIDAAIGALDVAVAAAQAALDSLQTQINDIDLTVYLKLDGSTPMTGALDMNSNVINGVSNGVNADQAVNRGQLDAVEAAIVASIGIPVVARVKRTTDQTMGAGGGIVSFDTEEIDSPGGAVDIGSHPTRLTAPQDGIYMFRFLAETNATQGAVQIRKNGGGDLEWYDDIFSANGYGFQGAAFNEIFGPVEMNAGDYVEFHSNNTSTGTDGSIQFVTARIPVMAAMFLINSAAIGGGDFMSDGSVPMTGSLDFGNNEAINAADATQPDSLTTLQQVEAITDDLQSQIDGLGGALALQTPEIEVDTGGAFSFGASWSELTASRINITLANSTKVIADAEGTVGPDFLLRSGGQIGIRFQLMVAGNPSGAPVDAYGTVSNTSVYGYYQENGVTCHKRKTLAAGDWRISVIFRNYPGTSNSKYVNTTTDAPVRLGLTYMA